MKINKERFLGEGAHWYVKELELVWPGYCCEGLEYLSVAQKLPKGGASIIGDNVKAYRKFKDAGIPTLTFYEASKIGADDCIICENLSKRDRLYVSPNTARAFPSAEDRLIQFLKKDKSLKELNLEEKPRSVAEAHLSANPVTKIIDIHQFVNDITIICMLATKSHIGLCEDMFFFGTNRSAETDLDLLVGDFDTAINLDRDSETFRLKNKIIGLSALSEFIDHFVTPVEKRDSYASLVDERITEYQKELRNCD